MSSIANEPVLFDRLEEQKPDALLQLIALVQRRSAARQDRRRRRRLSQFGGGTPILRSVKKAEQILWETQETKSYLGSQGDVRFVELIRPIVFGDRLAADERIVGSADARRLRRAASRRRAHRQGQSGRAHPCRPADLAEPRAADRMRRRRDGRSTIITIRETRRILFDRMAAALEEAPAGRSRPAPRLLPQSDRRRSRSRPVARGRGPRLAARPHPVRRPRLSGARQRPRSGCRRARGWSSRRRSRPWSRRAATRISESIASAPAPCSSRDRAAASPRSRSATSCSSPAPCGRCRPITAPRSRGSCSTIRDLRADWQAELDEMCARIRTLRARLAAYDPRLAYIGGQNGMFSMLPLGPQQVLALREEKGDLHGRIGPLQRRRPLRRQCRPLRRRGGGENGWLSRRWPKTRRRRHRARSRLRLAPHRLSRPGQPGDGQARGGAARPRAQDPLPVQRPRPRSGADPARQPADPQARRRPAAITARARSLLSLGVPIEDALGLRHGPRRRLFGRPRHRRRLQLSEPARLPGACRCRAASARNIRPPPAGRRRSTITATSSAIAPMTGRSRSCSAATPPARPAASGPR